jgi:hypothetical protein
VPATRKDCTPDERPFHSSWVGNSGDWLMGRTFFALQDWLNVHVKASA